MKIYARTPIVNDMSEFFAKSDCFKSDVRKRKTNIVY